MFKNWKLRRTIKKMMKSRAKEDKTIRDIQGLTAILKSPNFKELMDIKNIEETYKFPENECITTLVAERLFGKKFEYPVLKEGVSTEKMLYRHNIFMNEYFRPSIEKEKTSSPKEIKELRSKKRFKKWYAQNKDRILHMVEE